MSYNSPVGLYGISWKNKKKEIVYKISIPFNAEAEFLILENQKIIKIETENGVYRTENNHVCLKSGDYKIIVRK